MKKGKHTFTGRQKKKHLTEKNAAQNTTASNVFSSMPREGMNEKYSQCTTNPVLHIHNQKPDGQQPSQRGQRCDTGKKTSIVWRIVQGHWRLLYIDGMGVMEPRPHRGGLCSVWGSMGSKTIHARP